MVGTCGLREEARCGIGELNVRLIVERIKDLLPHMLLRSPALARINEVTNGEKHTAVLNGCVNRGCKLAGDDQVFTGGLPDLRLR